MIDSFRGKHRFLSNFYPSPVRWDGVIYATAEHAYQAAKTDDPDERRMIALLETPGQAKNAGRFVTMSPDWEDIKVEVMTEIVRRKFADLKLSRWLLATGDEELVEGNDWGDTFWGRCDGEGENFLGKILMKVRDENRHRSSTPEA